MLIFVCLISESYSIDHKMKAKQKRKHLDEDADNSDFDDANTSDKDQLSDEVPGRPGFASVMDLLRSHLEILSSVNRDDIAELISLGNF